MSVYVVGIRRKTIDESEFRQYLDEVAGTRTIPVRQLASTMARCDVLEGDPAQGVTIVEFPSREAALAWFNSDAYQAAAQHRRKGAEYQVLLVDAMESPPSLT
jgi:uncharacterized protein (DUF1330 family)